MNVNYTAGIIDTVWAITDTFWDWIICWITNSVICIVIIVSLGKITVTIAGLNYCWMACIVYNIRLKCLKYIVVIPCAQS